MTKKRLPAIRPTVRQANACLFLLSVWLLTGGIARAEFSPLPYYDDFVYTNAAALSGTNGWSIFTTGPGRGILPDQYHGWSGYPGGAATASNSAARLTGLQLVNTFGDYSKQPGIGWPETSGAFDKPSEATIRFKVDLSEATAPTNGMHEISRMGNMFWHSKRWHYENQSSFYTMMPVVRAFIETNGLITAYDGNFVTHLTHTPITNAAVITLTLNYETFKWSLWVGDELAGDDLGLYKPYMGNSLTAYDHMSHDGWQKEYDGLKEIGFIDNTSNGASLVDRVRVFEGTPSSKALPVIENFETRTVDGSLIEIVTGSLNGQNEFFASRASVTTDAQNDSVASLGSQGAQLNAGGELFQLFLDQQTNVWSDLWLSPVASVGGSGSVEVDVGGGHAVFYLDDAGDVYAYDGATATNIASAATNTWSRFTVESDYNAATWALYVDGTIVQSNLSFKGAGIADSYEEFRVSSIGDAVVSLDDVALSTESPFNIPSVTFDTDSKEIAAGVTEVTVTASLSWAFGQPITVQYALRESGTAMQVYDYSASDGALVFLPGEIERTFSFTITRDNASYAESDDTLLFAITNVINGTIGTHDQLAYTIVTDSDDLYLIPFIETFEERDLGSLDTQRGWQATYADVQSTDVYGGTQAATTERLGASLSHAFSNGAKNVSIQWREKPTLAQRAPSVPAGSTYAFYVSSNGYIVAFNGTTSTNLGNVVTLSESSWTHFKVNADYNTHTWTLFVNGTQVLQDFDFYDASVTSFGGFEIQGQVTVDNIQIGFGPPSTPSNFVAIANAGEIDLSWAAAQGATGYRLERGTAQGGPYSLLSYQGTTNYVDVSVVNNITYYYVVRALNAQGMGNYSDEQQATTRAKVTGLTAIAGIGQITLDWNTYAGATNYYIKRGTTSGGPYSTIAATNANSYVDASAANGRTYYYIVYAETDTYTSLDSDEISQAPALRTIFYDSFESPVVDLDEHQNNLIPNWSIHLSANDSLTTRSGIVDSGTVPQEFAPRHGNQCAWVWSERYIQTTGIEEVLEEDAYYKLSFNVAAEFGQGDIYYNVALMAGDTVLNEVTASWEIQENNFERADTVEFTTPIGHADAGEPLRIRVTYHSGSWYFVMGVDNVRLETSIDPPPVLPDPLTFSAAPAPVVGSKTKINMTTEIVTNGVGPILYNFENVTTADSSGWSDLTTWEDIGLTAGTEYGYRVKARDAYGNQNAWSAVSYAETFGANVMTNHAGADSWNNTNNWKNGSAPAGDDTARIAAGIAAVVGSVPSTYSGNLILDASSSVEFTSAATAGVLPSSAYQIQLNAGSQLRAFTTVDIGAAVALLGDAEVLGSAGGHRITFSRPISGSGKLTLAGNADNDFYLNAVNTVSGGVVTRDVAGAGHSLYANVNSAFASSDVTINANASLHIGGGLGTVMSNGATLYLYGAKDASSAAKVILGSSETVYQLVLDGTVQARGTHGAAGSGADYESATFSGAGLLTVTVGDDDIYELSTRNVTDSSAVLEGKLDVPFTSRVARVYWSTNNNANGTAWLADSNAFSSVLGTYSETVGQGLLQGLIGLTPNSQYYYTFSASNAVDVIWGDNDTFETVGPPVLLNTGPSATGDSTATLAGQLTAGSFAEITFVWGLSDAGTSSVDDWDHKVLIAGLKPEGQTITTHLTGLTYGLTYSYRLLGENALGTAWSGVESFQSEAPHSGATMIVGVTGTQATNISQTTATLQGTLDAPRSVFTVHAYWSTNNNADGVAWLDDDSAKTVEIGSYAAASDIALSTVITGLQYDTTHYYTLVATNDATNIWADSNVSFGTVGSPTVDSSSGASNVVGSVVTLRGELTDGFSADAYFVWDTEDKTASGTNAWSNVVPFGSVTEGYLFGPSITGFIYGVEYTYRVYVTNGYGDDWSAAQTFNALAPASPDSLASGGSSTNIYTDGDGDLWYAHVFTADGTFTVPEGLEVEYLILAGGGGGGGARGVSAAAGGGAGGVLAGASSVTSGAYPIVVGAGGAGGIGGYSSGGRRGYKGGDSSALGITSEGGGGGAYNLFTTGMAGGSGGGGAPSGGLGGDGAFGEGYAGGASTTSPTHTGGGGGGAGGVGGTPAGGPGLVLDITGTNVTYATGGAGGVRNTANTEVGEPNTGDGGSGGANNSTYSGADGGSGIVVIRYQVVPGADLALDNTAVTNIAETAVDVQGELDSVNAIVNVYAYWSTNNHADGTAWLADPAVSNVFVQTYNDVENVPLSSSLTNLMADTTYYYAFMATNTLTNVWALPSKEFGTKGVPVASSQLGATNLNYGGATLQGVLTSGGIADAWFVWDAEDRLTTSTSHWGHAEALGTQLQPVPFDRAVSGLLYGVEYSYRVYVSNDYDVGWSDVSTFTSTIPESAGTPLVGIEIAAISSIGTSGTTIHGVLDATQSVFTVIAYWSTNDHASLSAWEAGKQGSAVVGSYTNVAGQPFSHPATGLDADTQYYFTFVASNVVTNLLASPNGAFSTEGAPTVSMIGVTNIGVGTADIQAELTAGGVVDAWVVWDTEDALTTSTGDWADVASVGEVQQTVAFTNSLPDLLYGVTYYARVYVTNAIDDDWSGVTNFTTLKPTGVGPVIQPVSNVGATSATLNGTLNATQSVFTVYAFWSTSNNVDAADWRGDGSAKQVEVGIYTNVVDQDLAAPVIGLDVVTEYHYTFMASNVVGEIWATTNVSFSTVNTPIVIADGATDTGVGAVDLDGSLTQGAFADITLVWDTQDQGASTNGWSHIVPLGAVTQGVAFASEVIDLLYGLQYEYRLFATNESGSSWSSAQAFMPRIPQDGGLLVGVVATTAANVLTTTADLAGTLDATQSVFTATAYWSTNNHADAAAWTSDGFKGSALIGSYTNVMDEALSVQATLLAPGTTYYYTLVTTNSATNLWATPNASFTTVLPEPPTVGLAGGADPVWYVDATLHGIVSVFNGPLSDVRIYFGGTDGGTDPLLWDTNYVLDVGAVVENAAFSTNLTGLAEGSTYAYRVYVTNGFGAAWSAVDTFTTLTSADGSWLGVSGNWTNQSVWVGGTVARGTDRTANFTGVNIAANQVITNDTDLGIGHIVYTDDTTADRNLTIAAGAPLMLSVSSGTPTIDVTQANRELTIDASLGGTQGLTKTGLGKLRLGGVNPFSGGVTVDSGTLSFRTLASLGVSGQNVSFTGDSTLFIENGGAGYSGGTITVAPGVSAILKPSTGNSHSYASATGSGMLTWGFGNGSSTLTITDLSSFTGILKVTPGSGSQPKVQFGSLGDSVGAGSLQFGDNGSHNGKATFRLTGSSAPLRLNNRQVEIEVGANVATPTLENDNGSATNSWVINTDLLNNSTGTKTFTLGGANAGSNTFGGTISNGSGTIGVAKTGNGTWILSGTNTYSGNTTVSAGTLAVARRESLPDATHLLVSGSSTVDLGTDLRIDVSALTLGGTLQPNGVYGSAASLAENTSAFFTGTSLLYVGVKSPAVRATSAANIALTTADLQGALDAEVEAVTVTAYLSTTSNVTAQAWIGDGSKQPFVIGTFTNVVDEPLTVPVTGLSGSTTYYYTFVASNVATTVWATPSASFETTSAPTVDNAGGATNLDTVSGALRGQLTAGGSADAYIVWGGTVPASSNVLGTWDAVIPLGAVSIGDVFSTGIGGLTHSSTYYYRCFVSNDVATAWSVVTNFTTPAPVVYTGADGAYNTDRWNTDANWDNGAGTVPSGNTDVVIESGRAPWAVSATPAYTGRLTLESNATLGIGPTTGNNTDRALGTGPITLGSGSQIIMRYGGSYTYHQDIVLAGPAAIMLSSSTSGRSSRTFDSSISGAYVFTLKGQQNNVTYLNSANSFASLVTVDNGSDNWHVEATTAQSLGTGDVTIANGAGLVIGATSAMSSSGSLHLNGAASTSTTSDKKLEMDADNTIYQLYIDGVQQDGGTYTGGDASWIAGSGTLTVTDWPSSITNTSAYNVDATTADLAGQLSISNETFDVLVYWSESNNVGSAAWLADGTASNMVIGSYGAASAVTGSVVNLTPISSYYYTLRATNALEDLWASSNVLFVTPGILAVPVVTTAAGSTGVGIGSATLNGVLTTGGQADATIVWGTADGDTNSISAWQNQIPVGQANESFAFSNTVTGLLYGPQYAYRVYVTNSLGEDWSGLSTFTTLPPQGADTPAITNTYATDITATTADLVGALDATQSLFTVRVYWSESNNVDSVAWLADGTASNMVVGIYTNVSGLSLTGSVLNLTSGTAYYYTYVATNETTHIWASPSVAFGTIGTPSVDAASGVSGLGVGLAALNGRVISDGGTPLDDVRIYFGTDDGGTTRASWDTSFAFNVGGITVGETFSTNVTDLLYGVEYRYRVYASNSYGAAWSDVTSVLSTPPEVAWTPAAMDVVAWYDAADTNTVTLASGNVSQWDDKSGNDLHATQVTSSRRPAYSAVDANLNGRPSVGPGYNSGGRWLTTGAMTNKNVYVVTYYNEPDGIFDGGTYQTLFASTDDVYRLRGKKDTADWSVAGFNNIYRDGYASTTAAALPLGPSLWTVKSDTLAINKAYNLLSYRGDAWASWVHGSIGEIIFTDGTEDLAAQQQLEGYLAHTWGTDANLAANHPYKATGPGIPGNVAVTNTITTNITQFTADLQGKLDATQSVFTVTAHWSTTNHADGAAWASDSSKGSAFVGTYTNVVGQPLSAAATGMSDGTTYYYTFSATNAATNLWATPTATFDTLPPPQLVSVSPATGAADVAPDGQLVASFDSLVTLVDGGAVILTNLTAGTSIVMTLPDAQVTVSASTNLVITPSASLAEGSTFAVLLAPATVQLYAGISDTNTWRFTTGTPSIVFPSLVSLSPTNGATGVDPAALFVATFNKSIVVNTGTIVITNLTGPESITIPITDPQVSINGADLRIDPTAYLDRGATYAILIEADAIRDSFDNTFTGITNASTWEFATAPAGADVIGISDVFGHNTKNNYASWIRDLIVGSGMNGNNAAPDPWTEMDIVVPWPTNHPSTWTVTSDGYYHDWSPQDILGADQGDLDPDGVALGAGVPAANGKIGWAIFDLGSVVNGLGDLYIWNVRNTTDAYVESFNVYVAESPSAAIVSGPSSTANYSRDYDFSSGGWTLVNTSGPITGGTFKGNQVVPLGGKSGRYAAIEIMTNGGNTDRVGLTEVGITAADMSRPSITNVSPAHLETDVLLAAAIVATFDEPIAANVGNIVLTNLVGGGSFVIPVGDDQVTISGTTLTIQPTELLSGSGNYAVLIEPGAITDRAGNGFTGMTDTGSWRFTIVFDGKTGTLFRFK